VFLALLKSGDIHYVGIDKEPCNDLKTVSLRAARGCYNLAPNYFE